MARAIDPAIIAEIRELRANGATYKELREAYGVGAATIAKYCATTKPATKTCPRCGEALPDNAKFCFICGERLKTPREQLIDRVNSAMRNFNLLPEAARDSTMATMRDVIKFLNALED
jgi:predicted amidophosphoribosyltransferase